MMLSAADGAVVKQASDDLRRLSVMFSGILKIAPVFDHVVSLQQAAEESEGRIAVARDQEAVLTNKIAQKNAELAALLGRVSEASKRTSAAEKEAADLVENHVRTMRTNAAEIADGITAAANRRASDVVANAQKQAGDVVAQANAQVTTKKNELAEVSAALEKIKSNLIEAQDHWDRFRAKVSS